MRPLTIASLLVATSLTTPLARAEGPSSPPAQEGANEAQSETKARARKLFERGIQAYKEGRYKDAIDAFLDAHQLFPNPILSFNTARAYEKLGDKAGALRFYREYLRQSPDVADRADVAKRINDLESALRERGVQQVTVLSTPDGATVIVDDRPIGVTPWTGELFPGTHRLKLQRDGYKPAEQQFDLPAHRAIDVSATLDVADQPAAQPTAPNAAASPELERSTRPTTVGEQPSRGVRPLTWVAFGVGAVGFGGALAFELMRRSAEEDVKTERTQVARGDAFDTMQSRQTTARIFLVVGAVGTVAGGVLLYLDLSRKGGSSPSEVGRLGIGCPGGACGALYSRSF